MHAAIETTHDVVIVGGRVAGAATADPIARPNGTTPSTIGVIARAPSRIA
jgi:hypothetical protein